MDRMLVVLFDNESKAYDGQVKPGHGQLRAEWRERSISSTQNTDAAAKG